MIWLASLLGIIAGFAGHRTDAIFQQLEQGRTPPTWILLSRYGVGVLLIIPVYALMIGKETKREEATTKLVMASVSVGLGVIGGHFLDDALDS